MKFLLQFTLLVLGFTAITGVIGGGLLLLDTTGGLLNLSYNALSGSSFSSFFWPGMLLFVLVGVGGISVCIITYKRRKAFTKVIYAYALALLLFTLAYSYLTDAFSTLNFIYVLLGLLLFLLSWLIAGQIHDRHAAPGSTASHNTRRKAHHHARKHRYK